MGKSKVSPMKNTTLTRLELAAVGPSVNMPGIIKKELAIDSVSEYFWTNSQVVIGYIRNTQRKLKIFVANKVQQIRVLRHYTMELCAIKDESS